MKKFVTLFERESGNTIILGLGILCFLLISTSWIFLLGFVLYLIWVFKRHRFWFFLIGLVSILIVLRCLIMESQYQSVETYHGEAIVISTQPYHMVMRTPIGLFFVPSTAQIPVGTEVMIHMTSDAVDEIEMPYQIAKKWLFLRNFQRGNYRLESVEILGKRFVLAQIRLGFIQWIDDQFDVSNATLLKRLLLADISMDGAFTDSIRRLGIAHLFALSGMHLSFFIKGLEILWKRLFLPMHRFWMFQCLFLVSYLIITGFPISLIRASIMASLLFLPKQSVLSRLDGLVVAFVGMILMNPLWFGQVGFQLSFLVTGVFILTPKAKQQPLWKRSLQMATYAFLWTLPLTTELQGGFHLLAIPFNVIFSLFMMGVLLPMAFLTVLLPPLEGMFSIISGVFFDVVMWLDQLPLFIPIVFQRSVLWVVYGAVMVSLMIRLERKQPIQQTGLLAISVVLLMSLQTTGFKPSKVLFLDVNQGDSTLILTPSCTVLIDTGYPFVAKSIRQILHHEQRQVIDYLWITHRHSDHDGGISILLESLEIRHLIVNRSIDTDPDIPTTIARKGDELVCGEQTYRVYHDQIGSSNENNNSLVIHLSMYQQTFLFTGDLEAKQERWLAPHLSKVDYYQVGHHGSITSSTMELLDQISPQRSIISVGKNNTFDHPHPLIVKRFEQMNRKVHRTDHMGTLQLTWIGNGMICFEEQVKVAWIPWLQRLSSIGFCAQGNS